MLNISVIPSKDFNKVILKLNDKSSEAEWLKLIDIHNDYFINFIESWVEEFEISWNDFFIFNELLTEEAINVHIDDSITQLLNEQMKNKEIVDSFPLTNEVHEDEMKMLEKLIKEKGFLRSLTNTQLRDLVKMFKIRNSANFSVPGAGKTSVILAKILLCESKNVLVFVPNDVVMETWIHNEIIECYSSDIYNEPVRLVGNLEKFKENLNNNSNSDSRISLFFITYSAIENTQKEALLKKFVLENDVHVVLDESHKIKAALTRGNRKPGIRGAAVLRISMFSSRRDILSGTPMPHGIMDIVSQAEFLYPFCGFQEILEINEHNPGKPLQGLFARTTKEDLEHLLPNTNSKKIPVPMGIAQMAFYQTVVDFYTREFKNLPLNTITKKVNKAIKRIIELSVDPYNVMKKIEQEEENTRLARFISSDDREKRALQKVMDETKNGVSNKMQIAIDITTDLVSQGKKVVIWSQFTNPINVLEKNLKHLGVLTLYGGTKDTKDVIDQFNDPDSDIKILISNPQKGGEGISLHKVCHNAIYLDRDYDAAKYLQSRDRIHRIGLKNPKQYTVNYFFLESTYPGDKIIIDERISRNLKGKLEHMDSLLRDKDLKQLALDEDDSIEFSSPFSEVDLEDSIDWLFS